MTNISRHDTKCKKQFFESILLNTNDIDFLIVSMMSHSNIGLTEKKFTISIQTNIIKN